jgi:hypothetical protein
VEYEITSEKSNGGIQCQDAQKVFQHNQRHRLENSRADALSFLQIMISDDTALIALKFFFNNVINGAIKKIKSFMF